MSKNLFLEIKWPKWPLAHIGGQKPTYVGQSIRMQDVPAHAARVSKAWKRQVFCNNGWDLEWIPHRLGVVPSPIFPL